MGIWAASTVWLLWLLLWTQVYKCLLGLSSEVEFLDHILTLVFVLKHCFLRTSDSDGSLSFRGGKRREHPAGHVIITKLPFWLKECFMWYNRTFQEGFVRRPSEHQSFGEVFLKHWFAGLTAPWITWGALAWAFEFKSFPISVHCHFCRELGNLRCLSEALFSYSLWSPTELLMAQE
jgi:hypothetical protein